MSMNINPHITLLIISISDIIIKGLLIKYVK